jgi:uncharacterized protein YjbJ (UPF0337 family)
MNQHVLQGKWKQFRGGLKKQWGNLTDDDITRIEGSLDQFVGVLQERYGYTKERAEKEIGQYMSYYHDQMDDYSTRLQDYNQGVQSKVRGAVSQATGKFQQQPTTTEKIAKKKGAGWLAIVAGLALFALVFYLFNKQEARSFMGGSGNTGNSGNQGNTGSSGSSGSSHIGNSGQPGRPY